MKVHRWKTISAFVAAVALTIGAPPSVVSAARVESTSSSASDLTRLPLTDRHLTKHEKANLAVVLRAYHAGEGNVLDAQGFMNLFAHDGVLNGIGGVEGQSTLRGEQLGGLITWMGTFLPDVHRELKQITVNGDIVSIQLSIQGTFLGAFDTPAGLVQPTGAKIDFPTADFWRLRNGKIEVFDCHIAFTTLYAQLGILPDYASATR
ncbi:nuclear transport factor 2 family protein [Kribbella kalugense]|uniref:SnoaL-like protein n=1 Tax=Kribbella kalugense TaxID=2512221 RepID=A0A4R7ZVF2_9ACTN|nr:nuclear transport factor 2 family protein [Kribbella kalugense]TDW22043.1 SnoaL-like protein [Kribbella kalugense]